jgi:amino acid transporter
VSKNRQLVIPAIAVGVVLIVIAIVYWVDTADALPSFFPGHEAGSSHHHVKHGLAAFILGIGAFIFAWFQTGPATTGRTPSTQ